MREHSKITVEHLRRDAIVYVRQSTPGQVLHHRESTDRQYKLRDMAVSFGWRPDQVKIIDEDLGVSGDGTADRSGFDRIIRDVGLGLIGIVLGLEVSRLARNNADFYKLLDLCGAKNTLIGDADGIYHPSLQNDRMLLGLKGAMSESELHTLRARLTGGLINKALRGELRFALPIGLVWGEAEGEILLDSDESVRGAIQMVFSRFAEFGSARRVWQSFLSEGRRFPQRSTARPEIRWSEPLYATIQRALVNPLYAGAYVFGKRRQERYVDEDGHIRKRSISVPRDQWIVFIPDHHKGYIDWDTFEANRKRLDQNTRARGGRPGQGRGRAVREGAALLQGLGVCGVCGRRLFVYYKGRKSTPAYHCTGTSIANGLSNNCLRIGAAQIDAAISGAFLAAITPAAMEASQLALKQFESDRDATLAQFRLDVERARYEAQRAERRYRAVDPENRLVARGLEAEWEKALQELQRAETEFAIRERERPRTLTPEERAAITSLGNDINRVWSAPTTSDRDRKELLHALIEDVTLKVDGEENKARLALRWRGGLLTDIDVDLSNIRHQPALKTDEDTIDLLRRLAPLYPDPTIASIFTRQGRRTATGLPFTADRVARLRAELRILGFDPKQRVEDGELMSIGAAARELNIAPSTLHRWVNEGYIAGEQETPGAPWRIRVNDELRSRFVEKAPTGYVTLHQATQLFGVSRQTVLQRVKRGELKAIHVFRGRAKGLRIQLPTVESDLFDPQNTP
jgi:DNA invertase Pin-like site-specific DNA recombinase